MLYIGGLVVVLTFVAIIKKYETRLCLLLGGFLVDQILKMFLSSAKKVG